MTDRRFPPPWSIEVNGAGGQQSASLFNLSDTNFPLGFHLAAHDAADHARKPWPSGHKGRGFCPYSRFS
jgi:hypothetical protein